MQIYRLGFRKTLFGAVLFWYLPAFCQTQWKSETLRVRGGTVRVEFLPAKFAVNRRRFLGFVREAASALSGYYGKFPVPVVKIEVSGFDRDDGIFGQEFEGNLIELRLGKNVTAKKLKDDWTLPHEMLHLAFPSFPEPYDWLNEGMATYLEPIVRARAGNLSAKEVWKQLVEGLPLGLPKPGDRGLALTKTWGRLYWGGALFWFLADLEIRERSGGSKSVDTVMRALLEKEGDASHLSSIERLIEIGDAAVSLPVLKNLHDRLALHPGTEDLYALWKKLGVKYEADKITFDDKAPGAKLRLAITAPRN